MADQSGWRTRNSRFVFESPWFRVRQDEVLLPSGEEIQYNVVEHPGWALVVPLLGDGRVVMERVYRWPLRATLLECPAGGCDGDPPAAAAHRELEEETGYIARTLTHLGNFAASDGYSDERYDVFLATDLARTGTVSHEITEQIEVELIPLSDLRSMALRGEIEDGPSALAILLAADRFDRMAASREA